MSVDPGPLPRTVLDPAVLSERAAEAADRITTASTPANTKRSVDSALRYWEAWCTLRYGLSIFDAPLTVQVVLQFVLDHLNEGTASKPEFQLPPDIDFKLVTLKCKSRLGPLKYGTIAHRLAILAKHHRREGWASPVGTERVKELMAAGRKAQAKKKITPTKKKALIREPFEALLATCDANRLVDIRDRAMLLFGWAGGGRRRSEIVALCVEDLLWIDSETLLYTMGVTKTNQAGPDRSKPLRGDAAIALRTWLNAARIEDGPVFRRVFKEPKSGPGAAGAPKLGPSLSAEHVARIVKKRAALAGLVGDWSAHSLRSGYVTQAGREGEVLFDVMAMTEHTNANTVMGYYRAGDLLKSGASNLAPTTKKPVSS